MVRLKTNKPSSIPADDMKDGDIGVIIQWPHKRYVGLIVQRYKNFLICIGADSEQGWGCYFDYSRRDETCRVRLLEKGEELVVE